MRDGAGEQPLEGQILSHDHCDHLDVPTTEYLAQRVQRYFVPLGVKGRLIYMGVPAKRVQEFDCWHADTHAGLQFSTTPAQHFSGRSLTNRNRALCDQTGVPIRFHSSTTSWTARCKPLPPPRQQPNPHQHQHRARPNPRVERLAQNHHAHQDGR